MTEHAATIDQRLRATGDNNFADIGAPNVPERDERGESENARSLGDDISSGESDDSSDNDDDDESDDEEDEESDDEEDEDDDDDDDERSALVLATINGSVEDVKRLLDTGATVDERDRHRRTPLIFAAEHGHDTVVKLLIDRGADVDAFDSRGRTALFFATEQGHLNALAALIEHGAAVSHKCFEDDTPLIYAARGGDARIIQTLIENGASVEERGAYGGESLYFASTVEAVDVLMKHGASVNETGGFERTALFHAAEEGNEDVAKALIQHGASVSAVDSASATSLFLAAEAGHVGVMRVLLESGADPNHKDRDSETPMVMAAKSGHLDAATLLIESGASVDEAMPLLDAVAAGHTDVVKALIEHGASTGITNFSEQTPVIVAAEAGHADMVRVLIDIGGASVTETSGENDRTPLSYAAEAGSLDTVQVLIECGAATDAKDSADETALTDAARGGHVAVAKFLIKSGASVQSQNAEGRTPLFVAAQNGHTKMVIALINAGSEVDHRSNVGETALFGAASEGYATIAAVLIKRGAVVDAKDDQGRTPLFAAASSGHVDVIRCLRKRGADMNAEDIHGGTALGEAVASGHTEAALKLIKMGLKVNGTTSIDDSSSSVRDSLVVVAGRGGHIEMMKALVEAGASVNVRGHDGETPLISAVRWEYHAGITLLLSHGADIREDAVGDGEVPLISGSLDTASELCERTFEFRDMAKRVTTNLQEVCSQLRVRASASAKVETSHLQTLTNIVFRVTRLLFQIEKRENVLLRFIASRAIGSKIRDLLEETDHFAELLGVKLEGESANWKASCDGDFAVVISRFRDALGTADDESCQGGYPSYREPAMLLQYEVQRQDALSTSDSRQLLEEMKTRVLGLCGEESVSVPDWLISRDDLDYQAWNKLESNGGLEKDLDKYVGKWARTAVTIATRVEERDYSYFQKLIGEDGSEDGSGDDDEEKNENDGDSSEEDGDAASASNDIETDNQSESEDDAEGGGDSEADNDSEGDEESEEYRPGTLGFEDRAAMWFQLSHPNVVELYGANNIGTPSLFVFEHFPNGYLVDFLGASEDNRRLTWTCLHDIALGLQYLHQRGVVHGDLRCANFVVGADRTAKIGGLGEKYDHDNWRWRSPEIVRSGRRLSVTTASDIFALGMCVLEAVTLSWPWSTDNSTSNHAIKKLVARGLLPSRPASMTDAQWELVTKMFAFEPSDRASIVYIVAQLKKFAMEERGGAVDSDHADPHKASFAGEVEVCYQTP